MGVDAARELSVLIASVSARAAAVEAAAGRLERAKRRRVRAGVGGAVVSRADTCGQDADGAAEAVQDRSRPYDSTIPAVIPAVTPAETVTPSQGMLAASDELLVLTWLRDTARIAALVCDQPNPVSKELGALLDAQTASLTATLGQPPRSPRQ